MSEHSNSMLRVRAAQLHARLEEAAQAHQRLVAENTKLRAELAEAVSLLESIGYFADIQVTDARDDILEGGTPDDNAERWERIATFLFKRGFYDTTTQETTR